MEECLNDFVEGIVETTDGVAEVMQPESYTGQMSESEMQIGSIASGAFAAVMILIIATKFKGKGEKKSR